VLCAGVAARNARALCRTGPGRKPAVQRGGGWGRQRSPAPVLRIAMYFVAIGAIDTCTCGHFDQKTAPGGLRRPPGWPKWAGHVLTTRATSCTSARAWARVMPNLLRSVSALSRLDSAPWLLTTMTRQGPMRRGMHGSVDVEMPNTPKRSVRSASPWAWWTTHMHIAYDAVATEGSPRSIRAMVGCDTPGRCAHCACVSQRRLRATTMFGSGSAICWRTAWVSAAFKHHR